jgi:hypothetical protein
MNPSTASLANSSISRLNGTPARAAQHERAGRRWPTGEVSAHGTICLSVATRSPSPQTVGVVAVTDRLDRLGARAPGSVPDVFGAGTNRPAYLPDVKVEDFDAIFALNVRAAFFIARRWLFG